MITEQDIEDKEEETLEFKAELTTIDLFILSMTFMICPSEVLRFFTTLSHSGSWVTILLYIFGVITISMPLVAIQFFLAEYTRSSFLKVWDILPAFRGAGYITMMTFVVDNSFRGGRIYAGIYMLFSTLDGKWKHCEFLPPGSNCLPLDSTKYITNCSKLRLSPIAFYETFYYYENNTKDAGLSLAFIVGQSAIWAGVCLMTNMNIKWLIDTFRYILLTTFVILISLLCMGVIYGFFIESPTPHEYLYKSMSLRGLPGHLLNICFYSSYQERPGLYMYIASRSKLKFEANSLAMLIFFLKYIFLLFMSVLLMVCLDILKDNMHITDLSCLQYSGVEAVIGVPAAVIYFLIMTDFFTFAWFLVYVFWQIPILIITIQSIVLSICQVHALMPNDYKFVPSVLVCTVSFAITLTILRFKSTVCFEVYFYTIRYTTTFLILTLFLSALICYSVQNIQTDYQFQYGGGSRTKWMSKLKIALAFHITSLLMIYLTLFKEIPDDQYQINSRKLPAFIVITIIFHSPLLISFIAEYRKLKSFRAMFKPLRTFGPYSSKEKRERKKFIPAKFEKYRFKNITKLCRHACLANSNSLKEEMEFNGYKIANFRKVYRSYEAELHNIPSEDIKNQDINEEPYPD